MFFKPVIPIYSRLLNWLLPSQCLLCGATAENNLSLCAPCLLELPILSDYCQRCAQILPANVGSSLICGVCLKYPPPYDQTYALFPYENPIIQLIIQLKFHHHLENALLFGSLLARQIKAHWYAKKALPDLILPIPLHRKRLQERGFNQAVEIARPIARAFKIPIDLSGMMRIKPTIPQSGLTAAERKQNISKSFTSNRDYSGLSIAVLDDVITTGHTVTACCKILRQQGAQHIDVWCCARRSLPS